MIHVELMVYDGVCMVLHVRIIPGVPRKGVSLHRPASIEALVGEAAVIHQQIRHEPGASGAMAGSSPRKCWG